MKPSLNTTAQNWRSTLPVKVFVPSFVRLVISWMSPGVASMSLPTHVSQVPMMLTEKAMNRSLTARQSSVSIEK
jgi:hypothetical protein